MSVPAGFGFRRRDRRSGHFRNGRPGLAEVEELLRRDRREQLHEASDASRPSGLMARPGTCPVGSVEVLAEGEEVLEVRIALELPGPPVHRAPAVLVAEEDARQPP